jgi:hypothetical protein
MLNLNSILIALFSLLFSILSQAQNVVNDTIEASSLTTTITQEDTPFEVSGLFDGLEDILIPITAIITPFLIGFLIIFFVLRYRLRRKQAQYAVITKALEMGKDLPENFYTENSRKNLHWNQHSSLPQSVWDCESVGLLRIRSLYRHTLSCVLDDD